jgi:hypothetical protein
MANHCNNDANFEPDLIRRRSRERNRYGILGDCKQTNLLAEDIAYGAHDSLFPAI